MASGLYDKGREGFLDGSIDWDTNDIRVILIDTANYSVNLATNANLSDISGSARVATSGNLSGKTVTGGIADASDVTFSAVTGSTVEAIVIYKHTGTESTSRLIAYIDSASSGLPATPNGQDITIQWDSGTNKIFKL